MASESFYQAEDRCKSYGAGDFHIFTGPPGAGLGWEAARIRPTPHPPKRKANKTLKSADAPDGAFSKPRQGPFPSPGRGRMLRTAFTRAPVAKGAPVCVGGFEVDTGRPEKNDPKRRHCAAH